MKKIKEINVSVTYEVTLKDIEVTDEVYEALNNNDDISTQKYYSPNSDESVALDWLSSHVEERDGLDWNYSINDIQ